ncbi:MAG: amidohydrolase family protein [Candidatus Heimdallarchaeaceae archaeon]
MRIYQGSIITCDKNDNVFEYLVEDKGKIVFVGDELPKKFMNHTIITLDNKSLLPSFCDSHIHFSNYAFFAQQLYIQNTTSFEEIKDKIQLYLRKNNVKDVIGFGISSQSVKEKRLPFRTELDEWCPDKPLMIVAYDGHSLVVNSLMLEKLPKEIKDLRGYDPDKGHLFQEAYYAGADFITSLVSPLALISNMLRSVDLLAEKGIGMIHTAEGIGFPKDLDVDLVRYIARGQRTGFQFRVNFQTMQVNKVVKRKLPRIGGCFVTALDGAFGSLDAALNEGYTNNADYKGVLYYTDEQIIVIQLFMLVYLQKKV